MKIYIAIISFLIVLVLVGCSYSEGIPITKNIENSYSEAKGYYPEKHSSFMPNLHSGELISFTVSNPSLNRGLYPRYIHILMKYPKEIIDSIVMNINSVNEYKFTDTCLLVLDYSPKEIMHFKNIDCNPELLYDGDKSVYAPIPNFDFLQKVDYIGNYEKEATIYVLGCGRSQIIDEKYLRTDGAGLPESRRHGFT